MKDRIRFDRQKCDKRSSRKCTQGNSAEYFYLKNTDSKNQKVLDFAIDLTILKKCDFLMLG